MIDPEQYRQQLVGETRAIHRLLREASHADLSRPSPCPGWTVLDVGRHVEITPRNVAANLHAHLAGEQPPVTAPVPPRAERAHVLESLAEGAASLDAALARLDDDHLNGVLPGPAGPMPGRAALDLALTELTLHRCDIELGLGQTPIIKDSVAKRLIDVIRAWLFLTAPSDPRPGEPWCAELRTAHGSWFFAFDGSGWTDERCRTENVINIDSAGHAALALSGRGDPAGRAEEPTAERISLLKSYLPGP